MIDSSCWLSVKHAQPLKKNKSSNIKSISYGRKNLFSFSFLSFQFFFLFFFLNKKKSNWLRNIFFFFCYCSFFLGKADWLRKGRSALLKVVFLFRFFFFFFCLSKREDFNWLRNKIVFFFFEKWQSRRPDWLKKMILF